tara:strand:+ start:220 stop:414 length:195 start_codon:yes stop_codon:yes gene_type:complete
MALIIQLLALRVKGLFILAISEEKKPTAGSRWVKDTHLLGEKYAGVLVLTRTRLHTHGRNFKTP